MFRAFRALFLTSLVAAALASVGCETSGVGDPCTPESVPTDGFNADENYIETSSVECRTRLCLVHGLRGDPRRIVGTDSCPDPENDPTCVREEDIRNSVFCSCRCAVPAGSNAPECSCPNGFQCKEIQTVGGPSIAGSYCVRDDGTDGGS